MYTIYLLTDIFAFFFKFLDFFIQKISQLFLFLMSIILQIFKKEAGLLISIY